MTKSYSHDDIRTLGEIEHIRMNANMYISDTETPTHLIEEALDNSLDEALAGHATIIAVNVDTKNFTYSIIDNGRGIPIQNDVPITISSKLFSGAKFQDKKTVYDISAGMHGIGLVAVNALSEEYIIEVYRDKKFGQFKFKNTVLKEKRIDDYKEEKVPFSTMIKFKPDKTIFRSLMVDVQRIKRRLLVASVELPNCTLVLNVDSNREIIKLTKEELFKKHVLNDSDSDNSKVIEINVKNGSEEFNVMFSYSFNGSTAPRVLSSVNLLPVINGGTHVNLLFELLRDYLSAKGKKANLNFQPNDCLCGFRSYVSLELIKTEFAGQAKEKLNNRKEYFEGLIGKLKQAIDSYFTKDPECLENILKFFHDYRNKLDSKKVTTSGNGKRGRVKFTKLKDCKDPGGELFVVEGDSAAGGIVQTRNVNKHAIFPLKGKIPSIVTYKDILKNQEIGELIKAIGTGTGPHFDISKLRYDKIIISVDADSDGSHIFCLASMTFANIVPELIKRGNIYLALMPLYAISNGKIFIPLWSSEEAQKAKSEGKKVNYYKGLGEMNPWQLKICLLDEKTRKLIKLTYPSNLDKLMDLLKNPAEKRKLLEGKWNIV